MTESLLGELDEALSLADSRRKAKEQKALVAVKEEPKKAPKVSAKQKEREAKLAALKAANIEAPEWLVLVDSEQALTGMVEDLSDNEYLCLDVETTSLDWTRAGLVGISYYGPKRGRAYYIPLAHEDPQYHNLALDLVRESVRCIHANPTIKKLNHNIKFDAHILRQHGMPIGGIYYDTQIAANVLNENEPSKRLKDLCKVYLDYEDAYRFDELFEGNFAKAPFPQAHLYAAKDPKLVWELYEFQMEYLTMPKYKGLYDTLFEREMPLVDLTIEMERNGFAVDLVTLEVLRQGAEQKRQELLDNLAFKVARPALEWHKNILLIKREEIRRELQERGLEIEVPDPDSPLPELTLERVGAIAYDGLGLPRSRYKRTVTASGLARLKDPVVDMMLTYLEYQEQAKRIQESGRWDMNFSAPGQVAVLLFDVLDIPEVEERSTAEEVLTTIGKTVEDGEAKEIVHNLLAYREMDKTLSSFLEAIPKVLGADGRMHTSLNQYGTHTGRYSSAGIGKKKEERMGLNMQQIPNALSKINVRKVFKPFLTGDWLLAGIDYSQIEPRLAAHQAKAKAMIEAYKAGQDVYKSMASIIYQVPYDEVTTKQRKSVKAVVLGIFYGLTKFGLSKDLGITEDEAQELIDNFYKGIPEIKLDIDRVVKFCEENGYVETLWGRKRRLPEIWTPDVRRRDRKTGEWYWAEAPEKKAAKRQAYNFCIQGGAQDIIKMAMAKVARLREEKGYNFHFVMQIHDEVIYCIPEEWAEQVEVMEPDPYTGEPVKHLKWVPKESSPLQEIADTMANVVTLDVPLKVDVAIGEDWGELD